MNTFFDIQYYKDLSQNSIKNLSIVNDKIYYNNNLLKINKEITILNNDNIENIYIINEYDIEYKKCNYNLTNKKIINKYF